MKRRMMGMLFTAVVAGTLAACGSTSTQKTEITGAAQAEGTATAAAEETAAAASANYVETDDGTGLALRQWVGAFADCVNSESGMAVPWCSMLNAEKGVRICQMEAVIEDFPEGVDPDAITSYEELENYRSHYVFPTIVYVLDQDMSEEELHTILKEKATTDYTLTAFTTESGLTMYQADTDETEPREFLSEYASEETKARIEAMKADWEKQRAQLDYVEYQASSGASFRTVDYDGNAVDSSVFKNAKVTMVNIWATTCSYCIEEMPDLQELNDEMEDVQILTLLTDVRSLDDEDGIEEAHDLMSAQKVTLPVLLDTEELDACFPVTGTPTSYLVDQDGNILGRPRVGKASKDSYQQWIQEALEQMEK